MIFARISERIIYPPAMKRRMSRIWNVFTVPRVTGSENARIREIVPFAPPKVMIRADLADFGVRADIPIRVPVCALRLNGDRHDSEQEHRCADQGATQAVPHRKGQFNAEKDEHASVQRESDEFPYGIRYKVRPGDIAAYSHTVIAEQKPCGNNRYYAGNVYILRKDIREKGEEKFNGNTC